MSVFGHKLAEKFKFMRGFVGEGEHSQTLLQYFKLDAENSQAHLDSPSPQPMHPGRKLDSGESVLVPVGLSTHMNDHRSHAPEGTKALPQQPAEHPQLPFSVGWEGIV